MPLISVIVPVYNTEKYLHRCIDSILAQTFTDFELLLIDDGSTDSSGEICDDYAAKDSRVRVFHKENGGVSSARNLGLDNAQGEWITFVDSDDSIKEKALDAPRGVTTAELIITSHVVRDKNTFSEELISHNKKIIEGKEIDTFIERYINTNVIKAIWAKFFKSEILRGLRFDESIVCGEDFLFILTYLQKTNQIYLVDYSSYIYTSLGCHFFQKYQSSIEKSINTLYKLFNAYKSLKLNLNSFECSLFYDYKSLCQKEIYGTPHLWYNDENVRKIYNEIKGHLGVFYRMKYTIMSNGLISKFIVYVRGNK